MYVDAVCKGIDDIPTVDADTRQLMLHKYETEGLERLCAELKLLDPEYYKIVDLKNPKRVIHALDQMVEEGLVEEARMVYPHKSLNSLNTVGYKEIFKYLDGEWTLPFAIEKIKQNSRIYSRKQMTWFKRDEEIRWFHLEQEREILEYCHCSIKGV